MSTEIITAIQRDMIYAVATGEFGIADGRIHAACGYVLPIEEAALWWLVGRGYATNADPMSLTPTGRDLAEQCDIAEAER